MEGVEGLMERLQLSTEEKKAIKIGSATKDGRVSRQPQAVAKLFTEKNVKADVIEQTVGWIWCPTKGISCKDMRDNTFLITFNQDSGLPRAVDDGPWTISKELLAVEEFDGSKAVEDFKFFYIPIWIRVEKLPLGMMNREVAEAIGEDVGEFMEVDVDKYDSAVGRELRIKVWIDVRKPLRRGILIDMGEKVERWCPIKYEHLPDFCYVCGVIGHVDRACSRKLKKGEIAPFSRELWFVPPRKPFNQRSADGAGRSGGTWSWRSGRSDSGGSGGRSRSDGLSWRKDVGKEGTKLIEQKKGDDEEVTSPLKDNIREIERGQDGGTVKKAPSVLFAGVTPVTCDPAKGKRAALEHVNSAMQPQDMQLKKMEAGRKGSSFKRVRREMTKSTGDGKISPTLGKRKGEGNEMDLDELPGGKKTRHVGSEETSTFSVSSKAGLQAQPCEDQ